MIRVRKRDARRGGIGSGKIAQRRRYQRRARRTDRGHRVIQKWRRCSPAPCRACQPKLTGIVSDVQSTHASSPARVHTWMLGTDTETWPPSTPMSPMKLSSVVRCACGGSEGESWIVRRRGPAAKARASAEGRDAGQWQICSRHPHAPVCQTAPPRAGSKLGAFPPHGLVFSLQTAAMPLVRREGKHSAQTLGTPHSASSDRRASRYWAISWNICKPSRSSGRDQSKEEHRRWKWGQSLPCTLARSDSSKTRHARSTPGAHR